MIRWIKSRGDLSPEECGVQNLHKEVQEYLKYKQLTFQQNGKEITITRENLCKMVDDASTCYRCKQLKMQIASLQLQLKEPERPPDIKALITQFLIDNYEPITSRRYRRNRLFKEVNDYIREFGIQMNNKRHPLWRWIVHERLRDFHSQYRPFKIRRKH